MTDCLAFYHFITYLYTLIMNDIRELGIISLLRVSK